ncbi:MAG: bifunctional glutamate N-acetyltransferase/amino-acid acetyltransferase ArgJ [Deltaproteobacteria bacterium]|nr:bifunctional glutamate N-acetyltransferase/amino-acid acetyltransferase ArgJ [Deltaproteobacteria bacterium]MCB9787248.1 bifunctional glutamate N-acetyltransferase/amino-acid acetyltransferase ArgJ [Deltaproteobacteria bacterium]
MTEPLAPPVRPPLAELDPELTWSDVAGTRVGVTSAGMYGRPRDDVTVLVAPGTAAALTTRSSAASAPCRWTRARVPGPCDAVVINAGNSNAATGPEGEAAVQRTAEAAARVLGTTPEAVLVCSTGVIGVPLPLDRLLPGVERAAGSLDADATRAAHAILTTDLVPKQAGARAGGLSVAGFAKGSGMIHPNMGTMLAFVATDAQVEAADLQKLLGEIADRTFNCVTVDGDTSTSDTLIVQATGKGLDARPGMPGRAELASALEAVCRELSRMIARDGEGAEHLLHVLIQGTESDAIAREAARAVCVSPLVKTAVYGRDPNWGRVVGALGKAGVAGLDVLDLDFAGVPVLRAGRPLDFDEAAASAALAQPEVTIHARLPGPGLGEAWGCDLTPGYVSINADYRS